jgi:hypothetical protein
MQRSADPSTPISISLTARHQMERIFDVMWVCAECSHVLKASGFACVVAKKE